MKQAGSLLITIIIVSFKSTRAQDTSPHFITQPSNLIANGAVTLPCRVVGSPQPSVQWFKNNTAVRLSSRVVQDSLGSLQISSLAISDSGEYHCLASNTVGSVRSRTAVLRVAFIEFEALPQIQTSQIQEVVDNSPLVLSCPLPLSVPHPPNVTWSSTTNHIPSEVVGVARTTGDLVFSFFDDNQDQDTYTCTVSNELVGTTQISAKYLLTQDSTGTPAPLFQDVQFMVRLNSTQTLIAGETLYLECLTIGRPVANISWLHDNVSLSSGGRVTIEQYGRSLTIISVNSSDSGVYTCVAQQPTTTDPKVIIITSSGNVTVADLLQITSSFRETEVNITQPLSLVCVASQSTLSLEWTWFINGNLMSQTTDISYTLSGSESVLRVGVVGVDSGGVYQCVVTQPLTGQIDNANNLVTVLSAPPSFTMNTSDRALLLLEGDNVTFPCRAEGNPPPTFMWRQAGGSVVTVSNHERYSQSSLPGDGSLTIVGVVTNDSSVIQCEANNTVGSSRTGFITFWVIPVPMVTERPPANLTLTEGTTESLPCSVAYSNHYSILYQWRKELLNFNQPSVNGTLSLPQISVTDNGVYTCIAIISVVGVDSDPILYEVGSFVVTVNLIPPSFTTVGTSGRALLLLEGDNVTFPCRAEGSSPITYTWRRAGETVLTVSDHERYSQSSLPGDGSLTIVGVVTNDSSVIQCEANNTVGSNRTGFITFRVIPVPMVTEHPPANLTLTQGTAEFLPCSVAHSNNYSVLYQWHKKSLNYSQPSLNGTLSLPQISVNDSGVYTCVAIISVVGVDSNPILYKVGSSLITVRLAPPSLAVHETVWFIAAGTVATVIVAILVVVIVVICIKYFRKHYANKKDVLSDVKKLY